MVVRPFLTRDGVVMRRGFRTGVYRGDGLGGFNEFMQFGIVSQYPEVAVRAGKAGTHGDGAARGVKVESGGGSGGWRRSSGW